MLAVWVGLVDFLPLVGGLLAGVPTVAVAFLHSIPAGIVTVVVFLVYQQIENHVLYPVIVSRTVRLSPLWVLLAVLIGAETGQHRGFDLRGDRRGDPRGSDGRAIQVARRRAAFQPASISSRASRERGDGHLAVAAQGWSS